MEFMLLEFWIQLKTWVSSCSQLTWLKSPWKGRCINGARSLYFCHSEENMQASTWCSVVIIFFNCIWANYFLFWSQLLFQCINLQLEVASSSLVFSPLVPPRGQQQSALQHLTAPRPQLPSPEAADGGESTRLDLSAVQPSARLLWSLFVSEWEVWNIGFLHRLFQYVFCFRLRFVFSWEACKSKRCIHKSPEKVLFSYDDSSGIFYLNVA